MGALLGAPMATTLYTFGGWPLTGVAAALCTLPALAIVMAWPIPPQIVGEQEAKREGGLMQTQFGLVLLSGFVSVIILSGYGTTLSLYLLDFAGVPQAWLGLVLFMASLPYIGLAPVFGIMADTMGGMKVMTLSLVVSGSVLSVLLGPLASGLFVAGTASRLAYETVAMCSLGAALSMAFAQLPGTWAQAAGHTPRADQAAGTWVNALYAICGTMGPLVGIASVDDVGFEAASALVTDTYMMLLGGIIVAVFGAVIKAPFEKQVQWPWSRELGHSFHGDACHVPAAVSADI